VPISDFILIKLLFSCSSLLSFLSAAINKKKLRNVMRLRSLIFCA
jgi:hypothetical protein